MLIRGVVYSNTFVEQQEYSFFSKKESARRSLELEKSLDSLSFEIKTKILDKKEFFLKLLEEWRAQPVHILKFVDKTHLLSESFIPNDLILLTSSDGFCIHYDKMRISAFIMSSLKHMIKDARKDGVTLCIASAYRDYNYQKNLHATWIKKLGFDMAKKLSAPAGASQHQLGSAIDFYPANKNFTNSQADLWLKKHAHNYGFSLSYPRNNENITGYLHESWHYRYIGIAGCRLQNTFFKGSQAQFLQWSDQLQFSKSLDYVKKI